MAGVIEPYNVNDDIEGKGLDMVVTVDSEAVVAVTDMSVKGLGERFIGVRAGEKINPEFGIEAGIAGGAAGIDIVFIATSTAIGSASVYPHKIRRRDNC